MKKRCILSLTIIGLLLLGPFSASTMDCDTPPFVTTAVTPNVLIILDNSGSTRTEDVPGYADRFEAAKAVIMQLLADPVSEEFRWGLMRMDGSASTGKNSQWDWQDPDTGTWFSTDSDFVRHGGKLLRPVGTDRAEIIDYVNGMEVYDTVPHVYTVNGETLFTAAQYFAGGHGPPGLGMYKDDTTGPEFTNYQYEGNGKKYWASQTDDYGNPIDTSSPIQHWCQQNFVIYLTDGESNCDSDWDRLLNLVGDYDGDGADDPNVDEWDESGGNHYVDDVAKWMYENDLRTDDDVMPGLQKVVTYVVGLRIDSPLLERTADENHGRGLYFYCADYDELKNAFGQIVNDIIQRVASGTAVGVQSTSTQGARRLLRAKFVPGAWTGHLEAFKLPYSQGDVPLWDAGTVLKNTNSGQRSIFTAVDDNPLPPKPPDIDNADMKRKVFFNEANSAAEDAEGNKLYDLLGAPGNTEAEKNAEAQKIIRYIRGEDVNGYRARPDGWKLGDIAYSSPVIWGETIYVGGNDGMLHAFNVNTGQEKWAFIPNNLLGKLKDLACTSSGFSIPWCGDPAQDYCHEYFVDLSPRIANINGKTVLIGGEREGGDTFFALDITDPSPAGVQPMWEFSDPNLGQSWALPAIERCWLAGAERWVAFVGSTNKVNLKNKGYLFAVDVETGEKIGKERTLADAPKNFLPSIRAIDFDRDGFTDKVYVGSLTGELYLVTIENDAAADTSGKGWWDHHILTTQKDQPITIPTSLSLYRDPREPGVTNVMVYFGTGKYDDLADKDDKTLQSFYAVKDNAQAIGIGGLADQTKASVCTPIADLFGWYMDLNKNLGERVISSALVIGGYVFFTTFQPSEDPCEAGGIARLYFVNYDTGCVPEAPVIDINGDDVVDEGDKIGGSVPRTIDIGYGIPSDIIFDPEESTIIIQTSDTTIHLFKVDVGFNELVVESWREVVD